MMQRFITICAHLVTTLCLASCGSAADTVKDANTSSAGTEKAYQATYKAAGDFAYETQHVLRDGHGRVRLDISGAGPTVVQVLDLNTDVLTAWAEGNKTFIRRKGQPTDAIVMRVRFESLPKNEGEIGEKIIDGHKCHGYRKDGTEIWFDDEFGCPVRATSGGITMKLVEFSNKAPDASVFEPPAGYTQAKDSRSFY